LIELIVMSFLGLFVGGALGHIFGALYIGENPHTLTVASQALSAATQFLLYSFGGFVAIALSYFKARRAVASTCDKND